MTGQRKVALCFTLPSIHTITSRLENPIYVSLEELPVLPTEQDKTYALHALSRKPFKHPFGNKESMEDTGFYRWNNPTTPEAFESAVREIIRLNDGELDITRLLKQGETAVSTLTAITQLDYRIRNTVHEIHNHSP